MGRPHKICRCLKYPFEFNFVDFILHCHWSLWSDLNHMNYKTPPNLLNSVKAIVSCISQFLLALSRPSFSKTNILNFQQRFFTESTSASKFKPTQVYINNRKFLKIERLEYLLCSSWWWHTKHIVKATPNCFSFYILYLLKSTPDSRGIIFLWDLTL